MHDASSAVWDLGHDGDFRVRVQAALLVGRTRPEGARHALEEALGDAHPAVRTAAAAALAIVGDPAAVAALQAHVKGEASGAARAQMQATIASLSRAPADDARPKNAHPRYVVELGDMRNATGVRGDELSSVLREAARAQAEQLPGRRRVRRRRPARRARRAADARAPPRRTGDADGAHAVERPDAESRRASSSRCGACRSRR